jgi:anti-sigma factor RsiW
MKAPGDETLMAYADGEFNPLARASVEAAVSRDVKCRYRLHIFVATGQRLSLFFHQPLTETTPPWLVSMILVADHAAGVA